MHREGWSSRVIVGLPAVVLISWRYDITRDGISRTPPPVETDGIDLSLKRVDDLAILLIVAFIVGVSFSLTRMLSSDAEEIILRDAEPNSIAVLPFTNMSERQEDETISRSSSRPLGLSSTTPHARRIR